MYTYNYPRAAVTVDAILISPENNVLLIERGRDPFEGCWAFPGGFIEMDEDLDIACRRELDEETGIKVEGLKQFKAFGDVNRDPRHRTISIVFYCLTESEIQPTAGDDAANARWFSLNELPDLAFDHGQILEEFRNEILKKL